ncbi:ABC transporter substrate-binding protein [Mangrovicoccus ximenensis]|uniref:ABC transporter substrate-binding protein n=1 Tax=Mangrovicoccus ximenensis TaxID=1911570 RepID=UPI001374FF8D|nr:sugar ABC transporter substrate-binding protein [Mangrovicoccus ximenensis]
MKALIPALISGTLLSAAAHAEVAVDYWMWDSQQAPVYRKCADLFEAEHPGVKIAITQTGWNQYWTALQTAFLSGDAPDVFVNHATRLPEFAANGLLANLAPRIDAAGYDLGGFHPGLVETWSKEGAVYGLPKDWATVALAYDAGKLAAAGLSPEDLADLDWSPEDGGSFQQAIARMTVDAAGTRGNEPGFDGSKVATYGLVSNPFSPHGETEWSYLAGSTGWRFIDAPWAESYNFDDPRLAATLAWFRDLARGHHYMPTAEQTGKLGGETLMFSGKGAMSVIGSWQAGLYAQSMPSVRFAPIPAGPEGRSSMFNGLADSVWSGSGNPDEAWAWTAFLGSDACQSVVAESGIVFPAREALTEDALRAFEAKGIDMSAFVAVATPETTFPFPVTDYGNEISAIVRDALDRLMLGQGDADEILAGADAEIDRLF